MLCSWGGPLTWSLWSMVRWCTSDDNYTFIFCITFTTFILSKTNSRFWDRKTEKKFQKIIKRHFSYNTLKSDSEDPQEGIGEHADLSTCMCENVAFNSDAGQTLPNRSTSRKLYPRPECVPLDILVCPTFPHCVNRPINKHNDLQRCVVETLCWTHFNKV